MSVGRQSPSLRYKKVALGFYAVLVDGAEVGIVEKCRVARWNETRTGVRTTLRGYVTEWHGYRGALRVIIGGCRDDVGRWFASEYREACIGDAQPRIGKDTA